jgi:integrase
MTKPRRRQAGEGGISEYATKAGTRYLIKYTAELEDGSSRVVLKRGYLTRKAAAEALGDINTERRRGTHVIPKRLTVGDWLDQWIEGLRLADSTVASYRKNVRLHLKPHFGALQLQQLTGTRINAAYRTMEKSGRKDHKAGTGLKPRTVRYCHTILNAALGEAVDQGLLATNPASRANPPTVTQSKAPEMHPWTGGQLGVFLRWAWATNPQHAPGWHVLAYTGLRRGELLALRWRDLDGSHLSVRRSVSVVKVEGVGKQLLEGPTKGKKARVVDLDAQTVDVLRKWRLERAGLSLQLVRDDALIFGNLEGRYSNPERYSARFVEKQAQCRRSLGETAPPRITLHDLRHTHATLLLQAGVPVKVVSERLGHATVMITLETYAHVMPGMQAEAAATFAAIVGGQP